MTELPGFETEGDEEKIVDSVARDGVSVTVFVAEALPV